MHTYTHTLMHKDPNFPQGIARTLTHTLSCTKSNRSNKNQTKKKYIPQNNATTPPSHTHTHEHTQNKQTTTKVTNEKSKSSDD